MPIIKPNETNNSSNDYSYSTKNKNPVLALILSLLICGLGQTYNGQLFPKGVVYLIAMLVLVFLFWPLSIIVWIIGMWDAYKTAVKINRGEDAHNFVNLR